MSHPGNRTVTYHNAVKHHELRLVDAALKYDFCQTFYRHGSRGSAEPQPTWKLSPIPLGELEEAVRKQDICGATACCHC